MRALPNLPKDKLDRTQFAATFIHQPRLPCGQRLRAVAVTLLQCTKDISRADVHFPGLTIVSMAHGIGKIASRNVHFVVSRLQLRA